MGFYPIYSYLSYPQDTVVVNKDVASALKGFEFEERLAPVDGNLQIFLWLSLKTPLTL
jgi:hypothetical protein